MYNDQLKIYRGDDFIINKKISIHQPTLGEISDWGEEKYFSFIYTFTATPTDLKYQLHTGGIDWNTFSDYELFLLMYPSFHQEVTRILFGSIDFTRFQKMVRGDGDIVLYDKASDNIIDRSIYELTVNYIRRMHHLKKNVERAMTETTKDVLLEEAKEKIEANKDKDYISCLLPLISTMTNMEGFKYNWSTVWDMKINAFMDAVDQLLHIKNVDLLLSSGYSGFGIDLKKIGKKELNYFSRSEEN